MLIDREKIDMSVFSEQRQMTIAENIFALTKMMCEGTPESGINIIDEPSGFELYISKDELLVFKECHGGRPNNDYIRLIDKILRAAQSIAALRGITIIEDSMPNDLFAQFDELMEETK